MDTKIDTESSRLDYIQGLAIKSTLAIPEITMVNMNIDDEIRELKEKLDRLEHAKKEIERNRNKNVAISSLSSSYLLCK